MRCIFAVLVVALAACSDKAVSPEEEEVAK